MAVERKSVIKVLYDRILEEPEKIAIRYPYNGEYLDMSYGDLGKRIAAVSAWLASHNVGKGDRVAIMAENSLYWAIADMAISFQGAISVSIYPTLTAKDVGYIIDNSDSTLCFAQNREQLEKILQVKESIPGLTDIVLFEGPGNAFGIATHSMDDLVGAPSDIESLEKTVESITRDDPICIIYTSGTTGPPKGVLLTHGNILFVLDSILSLIPDVDVIRTNLSFLPLSHALERVAGYYMTLYLGRTIAFAESLNTIARDMKTIQPSHAIAVPRVFEKVFERIVAGASEKGGLAAKIFWWSVRVGAEASRHKSVKKRFGLLLSIRYGIARGLVFAKLKDALGGNLAYFISGGAPLAKRIAEFFDAADILVLEGWGATETSAPATWNTPNDYRFGSVGKPIPGVEVKIEEDGELLVRGPNVFREYWKMPDATREARDDEGWYHSGDIGVMDDEGYVYITDRKKELIITAAGKNISPANIESVIKGSPCISNALAFGDRKKYITALVTLEPSEVKSRLAGMGIDANMGSLDKLPQVRELIRGEIERLNAGLARFEQVKDFRIVPEDFSIEDDLLTPTMKLKRKNIIARYGDLIGSMYVDDVVNTLGE